MTTSTTARDDDGPLPSRVRPVYWSVVLVGSATFLGALALALFGSSVPGIDPHVVEWKLLVAPATLVFAGVWLLVARHGFQFKWRGHRAQMGLEEVVLFIGCVFLPLPHVVVAAAVAAMGNDLLRGRGVVKGAFNLAKNTIAAAVAALAVAGVRAAGVPVPWPSIAAPFLFILTTTVLLSLLFARIERTNAWAVWSSRFGPWMVVSASVGASFGLVLYTLYYFHPFAALFAIPIGYYLHRFGRLSEWAEKELQVHQHLADVSRTVAGSSDLDDVADRVLAACGDLFNCGEAQLTLSTQEGAPVRAWRRTFATGSSGTGGIATAVLGPRGEHIGEFTIFPEKGQRAFGEREMNLLSTVAASAAAAAANARALRVTEEAVDSIMTSERRYRDLFETANVFIHVLDADGRVVDANPAAVQGLEYERSALKGQRITDLLARDAPEDRFACLDDLTEFGEIRGREWVFLTASGKRLVALVDARMLHTTTSDPHAARYVVVARDVTGLKTLEADLRDALAQREETIRRLENMNRELEEFTLWVTHDMREPLRGVSTLAQFLWQDVDELDETEVRDFAKRIHEASERLKERVKALHAFSRIVQRDEAFDDVDLQGVVDAVIESMDARIRETRALVRLPEDGFPVVRAQPHRIDLVFANLLENALKYAHADDPVVEVGVIEDDAHWRFFVRDNGPGIPREYHERIFQLFQRGPGSTSQPGSGAGLAIVKRITEQHGGYAWVESRDGEGSTFWFTIRRGANDAQVVERLDVTLQDAGVP